MPEALKPKKIIILGGGMASLTTAFELTNQPDWNAQYDITVYQLGWRLGGKGASGRNVETQSPYHEPNYRIEEHGLHVFFGFYKNAFRLMKQCYDELEYDGPFMKVEDAFKPQNLVVLEQYFNGRWIHWPFNFPTNNSLPWEGDRSFNLWEHIRSTINLMYSFFEDSAYLKSQLSDSKLPNSQATASWWERIVRQVEIGLPGLGLTSNPKFINFPEQLVQLLKEDPYRWLEWLENIVKEIETSFKGIDLTLEGTFLELAYKLTQSLPKDFGIHGRGDHRTLGILLKRFINRLWRKMEDEIAKDNNALRRLILLDFACTNICGLLAEGAMFHNSLDFLDEYDYKEWLRKHGARPITLNSALVRCMYDQVYAYENGDIQQPRLGAGAAIRFCSRIVFAYKGSVVWEMQAGMGDIVFTPLYKVLQRRGVKFKFFHRVQNLHLSPDRKSIESISIARQVNLKDREREYDPLIKVKGLLCWPSEPLYEQIVEGEQLKNEKINLESFWTPWQDVGEVTLKAGEDFDIVVLGISLGALKHICPELIQANQKWREMIEHLKTVTTQGGQIWLKPTLKQLGWAMPIPIMTTYVEPLDTYSDMSHLIERENWPSEYYPYNLAYFTGVTADPGMPPSSDRDFPEKAKNEVEQKAINFLQNNIRHLWPLATTPENPEGLNWELLVDMQNGQGEKRFYSQFWRVNIDPSERYVLSVPGSSKYRLKTDESGFDNLYLTGDWINNGFNSGCIEATVMSGMQAARAILKQRFQIEYPKEIIGEWDSWLREPF